MDLAELRINRTPVSPNSKCEGCVHYNGNAQSKGGACEVGQQPSMCGSGTEPKYGYAPLAELSADEIDDLATPCINGNIGAMNENGHIEKTIMMKRVCLGDEDLTIAQRIAGVLEKNISKSMGYAQGIVSLYCDAHLAQQFDKPLPLAYVVAKSLYDQHFAPRKQRKYDLEDVLDFLKANVSRTGIVVGDDAYEAAGIVKAWPVKGSSPAAPKQVAGRVQRTPGGPAPKVTKLAPAKSPFTPRPGSGELLKGPFDNTAEMPVPSNFPAGEHARAGVTTSVKIPEALSPQRTQSESPRTTGDSLHQRTNSYEDNRPADTRTVGAAPKPQSTAPQAPPPPQIAMKSTQLHQHAVQFALDNGHHVSDADMAASASPAQHRQHQRQKAQSAAKPAPVVKPVKPDWVYGQSVAKSEGERGGHVIGHTKSGKPVYEHGTFHPLHFAGPGTSNELSAKHAAQENAVSAVHSANSASAKAHKVKSGKSYHQGETDPKKWSAEEHDAAADAHEEASVRLHHSSAMNDAEGLENKRGYAWNGHTPLAHANGHDMRAIEHRHKAKIAGHMQAGDLTAAHEAAQQYSSLSHGNRDSKAKTIAHVERRLSKVPHNEAVAKDADMEGRHDVAAKLRRMKKSQPNVRRIG